MSKPLNLSSNSSTNRDLLLRNSQTPRRRILPPVSTLNTSGNLSLQENESLKNLLEEKSRAQNREHKARGFRFGITRKPLPVYFTDSIVGADSRDTSQPHSPIGIHSYTSSHREHSATRDTKDSHRSKDKDSDQNQKSTQEKPLLTAGADKNSDYYSNPAKLGNMSSLQSRLATESTTADSSSSTPFRNLQKYSKAYSYMDKDIPALTERRTIRFISQSNKQLDGQLADLRSLRRVKLPDIDRSIESSRVNTNTTQHTVNSSLILLQEAQKNEEEQRSPSQIEDNTAVSNSNQSTDQIDTMKPLGRSVHTSSFKKISFPRLAPLKTGSTEASASSLEIINPSPPKPMNEQTPTAHSSKSIFFSQEDPSELFALNKDNPIVQLSQTPVIERKKKIPNTIGMLKDGTYKYSNAVLVKYFDQYETKIIQPEFMQRIGTMCVTELWSKNNKIEYVKQMRGDGLQIYRNRHKEGENYESLFQPDKKQLQAKVNDHKGLNNLGIDDTREKMLNANSLTVEVQPIELLLESKTPILRERKSLLKIQPSRKEKNIGNAILEEENEQSPLSIPLRRQHGNLFKLEINCLMRNF